MTPRRWAVLGALVAALVATQVALDREPEKKEEDRYTRLENVSASDMLPTYIASLFFGAFRAVAVDVLWIQLKRVEDEKRWYEARNILTLIAYFQPRNPEVWSHLGWHAAYNVANGFTDKEESWKWVRFGLEWLKRGNDMLPDSPQLKFELGYTLLHKPSWETGKLDMALLERVEKDLGLQQALQGKTVIARPLSAFELAIPWFERSRDEIFARPGGNVLTHVGLYLYASTMDGYIRRCLYLEGMYEWQQHRWDPAKEWFARAQGHVTEMSHKKYVEAISGITELQEKFYARLPEIVDLDRAAQSGKREDEMALLAKLQPLTLEYWTIDEGFFWHPRNPNVLLNRLKQKLARGKDLQECNDSFQTAWHLVPGELILANIEPEGLDVDYYELDLPNPAKDAPPGSKPPRPITVNLLLSRPAGATLDLKASIYDSPAGKPLQVAEVRGRTSVKFMATSYGTYFIKVEALGPVSPWPENTSYHLLCNVEP
jgi:hypothetical protein